MKIERNLTLEEREGEEKSRAWRNKCHLPTKRLVPGALRCIVTEIPPRRVRGVCVIEIGTIYKHDQTLPLRPIALEALVEFLLCVCPLPEKNPRAVAWHPSLQPILTRRQSSYPGAVASHRFSLPDHCEWRMVDIFAWYVRRKKKKLEDRGEDAMKRWQDENGGKEILLLSGRMHSQMWQTGMLRRVVWKQSQSSVTIPPCVKVSGQWRRNCIFQIIGHSWFSDCWNILTESPLLHGLHGPHTSSVPSGFLTDERYAGESYVC